jgi:hypothetical protein
MHWPRFSLRLLLASTVVLSIGMGGVGFALRSLGPRGVPRAVVLALSLVCLLVGVVMLVAKRRRTFVLIIALTGMIVGAILGGVIGHAMDPVPFVRGSGQNPWTVTNIVAMLGAFLGGVVVPIWTAIVGEFTNERDYP